MVVVQQKVTKLINSGLESVAYWNCISKGSDNQTSKFFEEPLKIRKSSDQSLLRLNEEFLIIEWMRGVHKKKDVIKNMPIIFWPLGKHKALSYRIWHWIFGLYEFSVSSHLVIFCFCYCKQFTILLQTYQN